MILSNIIANRLVGWDISKYSTILETSKRGWIPLIIFAEAILYAELNNINWLVPLIVTIGFCIWRYDGWGEMFLAQHGSKEKYEGRNRSKFVTIISDFIYANPTTTAARRKYGILWGAIRGLYDMPTFIALAVLFSTPLIAPLGLFMATQGYIYYLSANVFNKPGTVWPELVVGALRGILLTIAIVIGFYGQG